MRLSLAILVTLVACENHDVEQLNDVKRDVCACKDATCADHAMERVAKASIRRTARAQAIAREIMDCRARLDAATRPTTDPDAEGSAAAAPRTSGAPPAPAQ